MQENKQAIVIPYYSYHVKIIACLYYLSLIKIHSSKPIASWAKMQQANYTTICFLIDCCLIIFV